MTINPFAGRFGCATHQSVVLRVGGINAVIPLSAAAVAAASLVAGATSATHASSVSPERLGATASRVVPIARREEVAVTIADALGEIKRRAGLTWDNLARAFGVSRRTVHNWVNGEAVKIAHAEKVHVLLNRVRALKGLRPFQLRQALLANEILEESPALPFSHEGPILAADQSPFKNNIEVRRGGITKVVRSSIDRGK